jgi:putative ABC transport system substrate-binding protein
VGEFDAAFAKLIQLRAGGLVIGPDPLYSGHSEQIAALATRYAMPAIFENREFAAAGGLMSYSGSIVEAYRLAGVYTGRVLKGDKPSDLPVQRARALHRPEDSQGARHHGATTFVRPCGRVVRMRGATSAVGASRTSKFH